MNYNWMSASHMTLLLIYDWISRRHVTIVIVNFGDHGKATRTQAQIYVLMDINAPIG